MRHKAQQQKTNRRSESSMFHKFHKFIQQIPVGHMTLEDYIAYRVSQTCTQFKLLTLFIYIIIHIYKYTQDKRRRLYNISRKNKLTEL